MKIKHWVAGLPFLLLALILIIGIAKQGVPSIDTISKHNSDTAHTVIIDAGHGGIDGGATSCTGVLESGINLQIAVRLNDLLHYLGYRTVMIRTTDTSIYTEGDSIAAQKVSDLKERVRIVNETNNAILISIHQNTFSDSRYNGAQVFYAENEDSKMIANALQTNLTATVNQGSKRKSKMASGIYLMEHIACTGILIECGFLSNPEEEAKLRDQTYQQRLCCVIASTLSTHLSNP